MHGVIDLNLKGDRQARSARGLNTLRLAVHHVGPGDSDAWVLTLYGRVPGGSWVATGTTYAFGAAGTWSGPHVVQAFEEVAIVVTTPQETGSGAQAPNRARVEMELSAEAFKA